MTRPAVDVAGNLMQRAQLMTLYGTGMRRTEASCPPRQRLRSSRLLLIRLFQQTATLRGVDSRLAQHMVLALYVQWCDDSLSN
jgi:hypothetical protein